MEGQYTGTTLYYFEMYRSRITSLKTNAGYQTGDQGQGTQKGLKSKSNNNKKKKNNNNNNNNNNKKTKRRNYSPRSIFTHSVSLAKPNPIQIQLERKSM